jgi:carbon-monoxide dehydrogenase medium subunit
MIPVAFDYKKVSTVEEALAALISGNGKILAGGYSLIPSMKFRLNQPELLVDISNISTLKGIREEAGEIVIGAGTTHDEILRDGLIRNKLPFFASAAGMIGDVPVRNRGTIGGSLAHADPAADWPALVLAADANLVIMGSGGERIIKAGEFFTGIFSTQLDGNEIITAIRVPVPADGAKMVYLKFAQPASRFAIAGCAVLRLPDGKTSIAFTGVSNCPFRDTGAEEALSGKALDAGTIEAAVNNSLKNVTVVSDHFASGEYRSHLAKLYLKRALQAVA